MKLSMADVVKRQALLDRIPARGLDRLFATHIDLTHIVTGTATRGYVDRQLAWAEFTARNFARYGWWEVGELNTAYTKACPQYLQNVELILKAVADDENIEKIEHHWSKLYGWSATVWDAKLRRPFWSVQRGSLSRALMYALFMREPLEFWAEVGYLVERIDEHDRACRSDRETIEIQCESIVVGGIEQTD